MSSSTSTERKPQRNLKVFEKIEDLKQDQHWRGSLSFSFLLCASTFNLTATLRYSLRNLLNGSTKDTQRVATAFNSCKPFVSIMRARVWNSAYFWHWSWNNHGRLGGGLQWQPWYPRKTRFYRSSYTNELSNEHRSQKGHVFSEFSL